MLICMACKEEMTLTKKDHVFRFENEEVGQGDIFLCPACETEVLGDFILTPNIYFSEAYQKFVKKGEI